MLSCHQSSIWLAINLLGVSIPHPASPLATPPNSLPKTHLHQEETISAREQKQERENDRDCARAHNMRWRARCLMREVDALSDQQMIHALISQELAKHTKEEGEEIMNHCRHLAYVAGSDLR